MHGVKNHITTLCVIENSFKYLQLYFELSAMFVYFGSN